MTSTVNAGFRLDVNVQESGAGESGVLIYAWNVQETAVVNATTDVNGDITQQNVETSEFNDTGSGPVETVRTPIKLRALKFGFFFDEQDLNISADTRATFFFDTNTVLTESVQATIDAYTGITFDDVTNDQITLTLDGVTPVNNMDRLYDACHSRYSKAATPPQYDWLEVVGSRDKQNYLYDYDIVLSNVSALSFDLQGRSLVRSVTSAVPACFNNAKFTNGTLDFLILSTGTAGNTYVDVNVTNAVQFQENGTYTWDGGEINDITVSGATAVTLILLNGASVTGTVAPEVTVQNDVAIALTITDETDGSALTQARGYIEAAAGGPLAAGTVILPPTDADGSGVISGTVSIPSNQPFTGLIAEHGTPGLYVAKPITGSISATSGLSQTISLVRDE